MATKRARRKAGLGDDDLNDYWDPSGVTRNRKPNIGLSAEQVQLREQRMKRTDLKAVFASDKPTHHTEVFSNLLLQSENLLQAARQDENERRVASRMKKATAQYQKELNRCYRNDIEANRFIKKYKISPPVLNKFQDHDEISMIRYEPPTAEKGNKATFTITCGPNKGIRIPNVRVEYLEYYLGRGFVDKCISFGEKCATNGLNQPSFHVPLGDSNSDIASDICLFKIDKNGNGVKALLFVQGASDCCLGFSLANALHHLKYHAEAHVLYAFSHNLTDYDATSQFKMLTGSTVLLELSSVCQLKRLGNLTGLTDLPNASHS